MPWFYDDPPSLTKLKCLLKKMCKDVEMEGNKYYFTNHSLKATGATFLFDAGVPELIVQREQATNTWTLYAPMKG